MTFSGFSSCVRILAGAALLCTGVAGIAFGADTTTAPAGDSAVKTPAKAEGDMDYLKQSELKLDRQFPEKPELFDSLMPRSAAPLWNMPPPPQIAPIPNRRTRESLDQLRNWAFMTPDDIVEEFMARQSLRLPEYGPDGRERGELSVVERYYDRMTRGRTNGISGGRGSGDADDRDANPFAGLANIPSLRGSLSALGLDAAGSRPNSLADLLGVKQNVETPEIKRARERLEQHLDAFRQAMDFQFGPNPGGQPNPFAPAAAPNPAPNTWPSTPIATSPNSYATLQGTYDPSAILKTPSAPVAPIAPVAPGQPDPKLYPSYYTPPPIAPPRPDFSIPQRRF